MERIHGADLHLVYLYMSQGNLQGAVDMLKRNLAEEPDWAEAHGLLALCLHDQKRLVAAEHEARLALAGEPLLPVGHLALGFVLMAKRDFKGAEQCLAGHLELAPEDTAGQRAMARLFVLQNRHKDALKMLERARQLEPNNADTLAQLGELQRSRGKIELAEQLAQEALELMPEHQASLILMGRLLLRRGDLQQARQHAIWALRSDATDPEALALMAEIKTRANPFLGLWWRYSTWMGELGDTRGLLVLLVAFVVYRVSSLVLSDLGKSAAADLVQLLWLGICVYTWVGPQLFMRSVKRELREVELKPNF